MSTSIIFSFSSIFRLVADISSGTIFYQLVGNVILVALGIYSFEQKVQHFDIFTFLSFASIFSGLAWSFILCYSGTLSSDFVASIGDVAYNGNWMEYPIIYRKYILLMIIRSDCTPLFTGFKLFRCNLETFAKVRSFVLSVLINLFRKQ